MSSELRLTSNKCRGKLLWISIFSLQNGIYGENFLSAKWGYMGRISDCKHVTGRPELSRWLSMSVPFACMYLVTPSKGQIHECSTEVSQVPSTEQSDWWPEGCEILWRVCPLASTVLGPSYQSVPWVFRKGRLMSTSIWNNWLFLWAWRLMMSWCWHQDLQPHPAWTAQATTST